MVNCFLFVFNTPTAISTNLAVRCKDYYRVVEDLRYTRAGISFHSTQHYNSSLFHNYVQKIGPKLITLIFLVRYKTINFEGRMTDFTYLCSQSFLSTTW